MKKHYIFKFVLLLIPVAAFTLLSFSGGVGGTRSGSPGDGGTTCTICHAPGASFNASAMITTNIPATGYDVNTDYTITVTANTSAPGHGFQLTAERISDNSKVGTFKDDNGTTTRIHDGGSRISHANRNNSSWTFTWTSPSTVVGQVQFYASIVAANNNGSNGGDQVVTAVSGTVTSLSTDDFNSLAFDMYPNPSKSDLTIDLPSESDNAKVEFYDYVGRLALSTTISKNNNRINVNELSSGMYMLKVSTDDRTGTKKFIKQ